MIKSKKDTFILTYDKEVKDKLIEAGYEYIGMEENRYKFINNSSIKYQFSQGEDVSFSNKMFL